MISTSTASVLKGVRVLELAGLAPSPFCGLILSDFGADVIRIDRASDTMSPLQQATDQFLARGKRSIQLDLKNPNHVKVFKKMVCKSDVLIEPFRPGVMERLGLGPNILMDCNERLIYARLTGYGQYGAYAEKAGHDINYLALSGALSNFCRPNSKPLAPVNYLADFAAGGMLCAQDILLALFERQASNKGQVVDASMVDGVNYMSTYLHKMRMRPQLWDKDRVGVNLLDSGAPFYDTYACQDGRFMAVGAIEPKFYQRLLVGLGLHEDTSLPSQMDQEQWPALREKFESVFASKPRTEWIRIFETLDACVTPVLSMDEVMGHPHNRDRQLLDYERTPDAGPNLAPAPRLSRTPGGHTDSQWPVENGQHTDEVLKEYGIDTTSML